MVASKRLGDVGNAERLKRRVYVTVLFMVSAVGYLVWWYGFAVAPFHPWQEWFLPSASTLLACLGLAFLRGPWPFRRLEMALVASAVVLALASLAGVTVVEGATGPEAREGLTRLALWLPLLYGVYFLAFGPAVGMAASLLTLGTTIALGLPRFLPAAGRVPSEVASLLQGYVANGLLILVMGAFVRLTHAQAIRALRLEQEANTDVLTGMANRRRAEAVLEDEVERAERYGRPLSLVLFDLDRFKALNDHHGHDAGDEVLAHIRELLGGRLRDSDTLSRWGGEEFVVIAPEMGLDEATRLAERLRRLVEEHDFGVGSKITGSFGVAAFRSGDTPSDLLRRADTAMYRAKRSGRNRVVRFEGEVPA